MSNSGSNAAAKGENSLFVFGAYKTKDGKSNGEVAAELTDGPYDPLSEVPNVEPRLLIEMTPWKNVDAIIPDKLFLGNIHPAKSTRYLAEHRITHILSVCTEPIPADSPASPYRHFRIPIQDADHEDLLIWLPRACHFIDQSINSGGIVLVHSEKGQSRSAAVVAAYFMWKHKIGMAQALEMVRNAREQIWIKPGLEEQLVLFALCQYAPGPQEGIYRRWRMKVDQALANQ